MVSLKRFSSFESVEDVKKTPNNMPKKEKRSYYHETPNSNRNAHGTSGDGKSFAIQMSPGEFANCTTGMDINPY